MIVADNLWKCFPVRRDMPGFKEFLVNFPRSFSGNKESFEALKGVSLEVSKGECLGVIGRNGAGKSTLLSILLGVIQPSRGSVEVSGRKVPLLALGAGFHPDLTGRENLLMNGILLGQTEEEMLEKADAVIDFSELGDFIERPVRTYSSGMKMRLAFSVAVHADPGVLLIDEILSVGDESFRKKSSQTLRSLIKAGVATVYVSHNMTAVKNICDRVIWLERGEVRAEGEPESVVGEYLSSQNNGGKAAPKTGKSVKA